MAPGEALDFSSSRIQALNIKYANTIDKSESEISDLLSDSLRYEAEYIHSKYERTWVALTAGFD